MTIAKDLRRLMFGGLLTEQYNWRRPHQFNKALAPVIAEVKINVVSEIS
ncbi:hypothetical protein [Pseudomonas sp. R19M]